MESRNDDGVLVDDLGGAETDTLLTEYELCEMAAKEYLQTGHLSSCTLNESANDYEQYSLTLDMMDVLEPKNE